jgi:hypothetical protein
MIKWICFELSTVYRAVGRSENPGGQYDLLGIICFPLVEIGLTNLLKSGGAMVAPAHTPGTSGDDTPGIDRKIVHNYQDVQFIFFLSTVLLGFEDNTKLHKT